MRNDKLMALMVLGVMASMPEPIREYKPAPEPPSDPDRVNRVKEKAEAERKAKQERRAKRFKAPPTP